MKQDRKEIRQSNGILMATRRQLMGITQKDLAQALGKTRDVVANFESGRQEAYIGEVFEIAAILGTQIEDLLAAKETIGTDKLTSIATNALPVRALNFYGKMLAKPGAYLDSHEPESPET